ncbi:conserved Plasmodium protein, unknown function [Plasmodium gonderi]|uniref:Uncharacterized protein n=1 Tax=Plasmodium gonderi TaxID=77519 RepID=A0A1Y1JF28_PLAGO|nr:conserved Plasmodium protein, unknown function [Plasmodium gonderi]GAW79342.1 conserved Plasmodium protein, unknown function [Plasmodium gonderi]
MVNKNKPTGEFADYNRTRYYNPKVHVSGWSDIQQDEAYIMRYNQMRDFYLSAYPTENIDKKYLHANRKWGRKNLSDKRVIFYEESGDNHWVTENKDAFKEGDKLSQPN